MPLRTPKEPDLLKKETEEWCHQDREIASPSPHLPMTRWFNNNKQTKTVFETPDFGWEVEILQVNTKLRTDSLKQVIWVITLYPQHSFPQACTSKCQERKSYVVILSLGGKKKTEACFQGASQETGFSLTSFGALKEPESFRCLENAENKELVAGWKRELFKASMAQHNQEKTYRWNLLPLEKEKRVQHIFSTLAFPRAAWGNDICLA